MPDIPEDWITHDGGPCPVPPETRVVVRYRADPDGFDFEQYRRFTAGGLVWQHYATAPSSDIIAYKLPPAQSPPLRAG